MSWWWPSLTWQIPSTHNTHRSHLSHYYMYTPKKSREKWKFFSLHPHKKHSFHIHKQKNVNENKHIKTLFLVTHNVSVPIIRSFYPFYLLKKLLNFHYIVKKQIVNATLTNTNKELHLWHNLKYIWKTKNATYKDKKGKWWRHNSKA